MLPVEFTPRKQDRGAPLEPLINAVSCFCSTATVVLRAWINAPRFFTGETVGRKDKERLTQSSTSRLEMRKVAGQTARGKEEGIYRSSN